MPGEYLFLARRLVQSLLESPPLPVERGELRTFPSVVGESGSLDLLVKLQEAIYRTRFLLLQRVQLRLASLFGPG